MSIDGLPVRVDMLDLPMPKGVCDAIVARPRDERPCPPVLFIMDAIGLRPRIRHMVARVASHGYAVLAPNVFYRAGRQPLVDPALLSTQRRDERMARFGELFGALTGPDWVADGPAYLQQLGTRPELAPVTDAPARVVGYCMGGRLGLSLAAQCPDSIAAVAAFHPGGLVTEGDDSPHLLLPAVRARLLFRYADEDASMTPDQQRVFTDAARAAGRTVHAGPYPGAQHGFTMSDLPAFDAAATERHWTELIPFLAG